MLDVHRNHISHSTRQGASGAFYGITFRTSPAGSAGPKRRRKQLAITHPVCASIRSTGGCGCRPEVQRMAAAQAASKKGGEVWRATPAAHDCCSANLRIRCSSSCLISSGTVPAHGGAARVRRRSEHHVQARLQKEHKRSCGALCVHARRLEPG